ncbi:MAG: DUF5908 family protein [Alphaproteobacteria bacterium]
MPVFIGEIVFRGEIQDRGAAPEASGRGDARPAAEAQDDRNRLIEDCVAEVLRILARERER